MHDGRDAKHICSIGVHSATAVPIKTGIHTTQHEHEHEQQRHNRESRPKRREGGEGLREELRQRGRGERQHVHPQTRR